MLSIYIKWKSLIENLLNYHYSIFYLPRFLSIRNEKSQSTYINITIARQDFTDTDTMHSKMQMTNGNTDLRTRGHNGL